MKIFDFRFLTDLHVLLCSEHDFTILQNVCLCAYDKNFVAALAQKLLDGIAWDFKLSCILWYTGEDKILVPIAQEVPLLFKAPPVAQR